MDAPGIRYVVHRRVVGFQERSLARAVLSPRVAFLDRHAHSHGVNTLLPSRRAQRLIATCAVFLLAAFVGGCGASRTAGHAPNKESAANRTLATRRHAAATSSTSAPLTTTRSDEQVVAAVRAYWTSYLELAGRSGPFDASSSRSVLAQVATGAALDRLLSVLRTNAAAGYVVRGSIVSSPRAVSLVGSSATASDCYDDHSGVFQIVDGARLDQDDPLPHLATMGLVLESDGWKVSSVDQLEGPCAGS